MNDIEIARRLIERLGGADAAYTAIHNKWRESPELAAKYWNYSEKFQILYDQILMYPQES